MQSALKAFLLIVGIIAVFVILPVIMGQDPGFGIVERWFGVRAIPFIEPGSLNKANEYSHQNEVNWTTKPVIENGYLVAAGSTKNNARLALNPPGGFATFVLKRRNTDSTLFVIVKPPSGGRFYTSRQDYIIASTWDVSPTQFLIRAPASKIKEPADLLVWGASTFSPLTIHSVYVAE